MADLLSASGIDWRDQSRRDSLDVYMVSPNCLLGYDGNLEDIRLTGGSIDAGFYTDGRVSAKIRYEGNSWKRNRALRIAHTWSLDGVSGRRALGTFLVTRDDGDFEDGRWVGDLTCQSMMWALTKRKLAGPLTVKQGSKSREVMMSLLRDCGRPYRDLCEREHMSFADNKVYESGKTYADVLDDLSEMSNIRLDVDGAGYITLNEWQLPALQSPKFELSVDDPRGIMHDSISRGSNFAELPSEVVVHCKYSVEVQKPDGVYKSNSGEHKAGDPKYKKVHEQRELNGIARISGGPSSAAERGFALTDFRTVDDKELEPKTQDAIDARARIALSRLPGECTTWTVTTQYFPVWEGDVGYVILPTESEGRQRVKVFVRNLSLDLGTMELQLTLQETNSWNEEIYGLSGPDSTNS